MRSVDGRDLGGVASDTKKITRIRSRSPASRALKCIYAGK